MIPITLLELNQTPSMCSQKHIGSIRLQLAVAKEVVLKLERAQDRRPLTSDEAQLRRELRYECMGLASLARTIAQQRSRIQFIAARDANTKFFQLQACHRNKKNLIASLRTQDSVVVDEAQKGDALFHFFDAILGTSMARSHRLSFQALELLTTDTTGTDACFSEAEIWGIIWELPSEKSVGARRLHGLVLQDGMADNQA